jgi:transcriptional regulator with XRE-family HTH domain
MCPQIGYGDALREFRQERGWTQDQMAKLLATMFRKPRIARAVVSQYETERLDVSLKRLRAIEELVGVKPGTFIAQKMIDLMEKEAVVIPDLAGTLQSYINKKK